MKNYNKSACLILAGCICIGGGLGVIYINQGSFLDAFLLAVLGGICVVQAWRQALNTRTSVKMSYGRIRMWLYPFLLFGGLVAINVLANRLNWQWDTTRAKQHTLHVATIDLLEGLQDDIEMVAFYVGLPPKYLEDLLQQYEKVSRGQVTMRIVDPLIDIGLAAEFGDVINSQEHKVIVRNTTQRQDVDFTGSSLTENQLNNAILRLARRTRKVYFLTGHGEANIYNEEDKGFSQWRDMLAANQIDSARLLINMRGKIPDDCDVLIVAGPQKDLPQDEQEIIQEYLEKGGDALFLIEHTVITTPDRALTSEELNLNPSLNSLLNQWGVMVASDVVLDAASHAAGDVGSPATRNYLGHRAIVGELDYTFYVRPRSISFLAQRRPTIKVAPLVLTESKEKSWGETNRQLQINFDEGVDRPGPVPIAFVMWEPKKEGESSDTRIVVFTDADFLTNVFINQYSNAQMGLNAVNWLSELDYQMFVPKLAVNETVPRLDLTSRQKRMVLVWLMSMPLALAGLGLWMWIQQRA